MAGHGPALGAVQDVHEEIDDWLTIDSASVRQGWHLRAIHDNEPDQKVEFTAAAGARPRGAVSPSGFHGIVIRRLC